jgi:hypothetical protein
MSIQIFVFIMPLLGSAEQFVANGALTQRFTMRVSPLGRSLFARWRQMW